MIYLFSSFSKQKTPLKKTNSERSNAGNSTTFTKKLIIFIKIYRLTYIHIIYTYTYIITYPRIRAHTRHTHAHTYIVMNCIHDDQNNYNEANDIGEK